MKTIVICLILFILTGIVSCTDLSSSDTAFSEFTEEEITLAEKQSKALIDHMVKYAFLPYEINRIGEVTDRGIFAFIIIGI